MRLIGFAVPITRDHVRSPDCQRDQRSDQQLEVPMNCALGAVTPLSAKSDDNKLLQQDHANHRNASAESLSVFFEDAAVHHYENSRLAGFLRRLLMNHVLLHPNGGNAQLNGLIHYFRDEL